jgi:hypothetical protein
VRTESTGPLLSCATRCSVTQARGIVIMPFFPGRTTRPDTVRGADDCGGGDAGV